MIIAPFAKPQGVPPGGRARPFRALTARQPARRRSSSHHRHPLHEASRRATLLALITLLLCAGCRPKPPLSDAELFQQAAKAIERNDIAAAKTKLDELLARKPDHAKAILFRAQFAADDGDVDAALQLLKRVGNSPKTIGGTARFLEGALAAEKGLARLAESKWIEAVQLHPAYPQPKDRLAKLYLLQYRGEEAEAVLLALRQLRPWSLQEYVMWQLARSGAAQASDAVEELERYLRGEPENVVIRTALAQRLLILERFGDAQQALAPLLADANPDGRALGLWACATWAKGDLSAVLSRLPKNWPDDDADPWLWRAYAQIATDGSDWPAAAACWWSVFRQLPDDREAAYRLAQALERCGRNDDAQTLFAEARLLEQLIDYVRHMLEGDQRRKDLASEMVSKIIGFLIQLQRPREAALWLELLAAWNPHDARLPGEIRRLSALKPPPDLPTRLADLGRWLLANRPERPDFDRDFRKALVSKSSSADNDVPIRVEDVGAQAGLDFQHFNGPTEFKYLLETLGGAVAVLDFDADGWPDLYFPQGCRIPYNPADREFLDQLYRNRGDGRFERVTDFAGIVENRYSQGVAAGDFNNDGFPDLFVANFGENALFVNNGDGTFSDVSASAGLFGDDWSSSAAWADLDLDGDLDLYVVKYVKDPFKTCRKPDGTIAACSPGNFEGADDQFYVNQGDGTFVERLADAGLAAPNGKGLGIVVADFDDDGLSDVYVANDGTPNFLFHHLGKGPDGLPRFEEIGLASGSALSRDGRAQAGMGIACADLNGDGRLDLYVTNFFDDYNTLYLNQGTMTFEDLTRPAGLVEPTMPMLGFGTQAIDFDLDRRADLIVANGHIDNHSAEGIPWKMPGQVFHNLGQGTFQDVSATVGPYFREAVLGRALARCDANRDGRPDAVVVHQDRPAALLENRTETPRRAVSLRFIGTASNRDAIGVRVTATFADDVVEQQLCGGDGYFTTNDRRMLLGTKDDASIRRIVIRWPSGRAAELSDVAAGSSLILLESGDVKEDSAVR